MKRIVVTLYWLTLVQTIVAQGDLRKLVTGSLRGRVMDTVAVRPVEFATITVYDSLHSKVLGGTTTDGKGGFSVSGLPFGSYRVSIGFVGYRTRELSHVVLNAQKPVADLGTVVLVTAVQILSDVTVTAQKGVVENKIDKLVFNAEKDITSQGGVATDLLRKVPMVSVDVDGNVELQGNSNILFLINGKPSSIFGNNLVDALQSIPASQIKSIEVITSPGAKYDAEGTAGIINIILKDSKVQGINGTLSLSGGTRLENASMNLHAKKGNLGLNAFFSGNAQLNSTTLNSMNRPSFDSTGTPTSNLLQNGQSDFSRNGMQTGLGFDWSVNKKNDFSGGIGYDNFGNRSDGYSYQQLLLYDSLGAPSSSQYSLIHSLGHFRGQSVDWNLNYKKTFSTEGQELNILYLTSYGLNTTYFDQYQTSTVGDTLYGGNSSNNSGIDRESSVQADYVQPFSETVKLETGAKLDLRKITSNTAAYSLNAENGQNVYDTAQSNWMIYNRNIYAGYASISFPVGKFLDVRSGLRYEYTQTDASFSGVESSIVPSYHTWAPALIVSHSFNEDQSIKFSYTKRIQRPGYRSLNPFVNISDPKNLTQGNPNLEPEIANNFDLTYTRSFDKGSSLNIVAFYHRSAQDIQPYVVYYPSYVVGDSIYTNVSVTTPENVGIENNYGFNFFGTIPFTPKFSVRGNLSTFERYIVNTINPGSNSTSFNYRINLNLTYQINKDFVAEAFGNFNSPRNEVQGRFPSFTSYSLALRKQVWNKKGSFGFTTTNPFNQYVNQTTAVTGEGFVLNSTRKIPYRSFGLSFTYKFGKLEFKEKKEERPAPGLPDENN